MSMKFTYQYDDVSPLVEVTISPQSTLLETLEAFEGFLKAAGYHFDGELDFVQDLETVDPEAN